MEMAATFSAHLDLDHGARALHHYGRRALIKLRPPRFRSSLLCYDVDHETRFAMTSKSWIRRLGVRLIVFVLIVAASVSSMHAFENAPKVSVVSFGLFGDQAVFRREAS